MKCDFEDNFIYSVVKTFLWSAVSILGSHCNENVDALGCAGNVMWRCVMMSDTELREGSLLLSSGAGEVSEWPQQFLDVHSNRTRGDGTRLKEGKCYCAGEMKG